MKLVSIIDEHTRIDDAKDCLTQSHETLRAAIADDMEVRQITDELKRLRRSNHFKAMIRNAVMEAMV